MKLITTLIVALFAVSSFAAEPAKKEEAKSTASVPAKAEVKKEEKKPVKSSDQKDTKAAAPASK